MKKFDEDLNVAVFTTKHVIDGKDSILFVFHHEEDGFWEFIGKQSVNEEDARIISLEEMIELDPTILDIADLPLGWKAERKNSNSKWIITPC